MVHLRGPHRMMLPPRMVLLPFTRRVAGAVLGGIMACAAPLQAAQSQTDNTLWVQAGDTASGLVWPLLPAGATIDQMLVALWRANPDAFIDNNVNLLRAEVRLQVPAPEQVLRTSVEEARETVLDHHSRFHAHAQRLAEQARTLPEGSARGLSASVEQARQSQATTPTGQDKLTLTKDLQDAQAMKVALEKQTQEAMAHLAALQKNIEALQALSQSSAPTPSAPSDESLPAWAWVLGAFAVSLTVVMGLRRRNKHTPPPENHPPMAVPAQLASISLDLDLDPHPPAGPKP